jgi:hypothetical protein
MQNNIEHCRVYGHPQLQLPLVPLVPDCVQIVLQFTVEVRPPQEPGELPHFVDPLLHVAPAGQVI